MPEAVAGAAPPPVEKLFGGGTCRCGSTNTVRVAENTALQRQCRDCGETYWYRVVPTGDGWALVPCSLAVADAIDARRAEYAGS